MTDKGMILSNIKLHYGLRTDADFARFLEIKPQTLASWYKRNSFDIELLYAKCEDISPDWLLTGFGEMLRKNISQSIIDSPNASISNTAKNRCKDTNNKSNGSSIIGDNNEHWHNVENNNADMSPIMTALLAEKDERIKEKDERIRELMSEKEELKGIIRELRGK